MPTHVKPLSVDKCDAAVLARATDAQIWQLLLTELGALASARQGDQTYWVRRRRLIFCNDAARELHARGLQLTLPLDR